MFTFDAAIDAVQNSKKTFVNTFVQHEAIANALNSFVDAQAEYTKKAAKVGLDTATVLTQESIKAAQAAYKTAQDTAKYEYAKFSDAFTKAFTDMGKATAKAYSKKAV
jgi:spore coat polysaccharide biosynthesis protein SpsF (cytidylyltransferase family)